jgi:hypothetical protein
MKKTAFIIAVFAALFALITASTNNASDGVTGSVAPVFKIERADSTVKLDNLKGEWVLLQFWTSADASSRLAVNEYSRIYSAILKDVNREPFRLLAVNFDRSQAIFNEIVRRDGLNANSQFYVENDDLRNRLAKSYHLDGGMKALLINPNGQIVAVNPSAETIKKAI